MVSSAINKILLQRSFVIVTVFFVWAVVVLCFAYPFVTAHKFVTLHKILKNKELTIITKNTAHCYYLYRDEPMGFEYELTNAFADYLNVRLKIRLADDLESMIPALMDGSAALIAAGIITTPTRQKEIAFSDGYMEIQHTIITHRNNFKINNPHDLAGKTIHVTKGTPYQYHLEKLRDEGTDLFIQLYEDVPTEELIQKVSEKEIEVTVADSNIAILNRRHYPGAVMRGTIGDKQQLGWAVNPKARQLLVSINSFFRTIKENRKFDEIYNKYYGDKEDFDYVDLRAFHRRIKTRLSRYSPFIKAAARKHGFDWRLIVAQIYQESHLNPWARSHAGARGLMQLLPGTARSLGVKDIHNPVENINAGVQHLRNLYDHFDSAQDEDRLRISLAAYNIGEGHIGDARDLAVKMKLNPDQWSSLAKTLPLLRYRKYYKNSKYGYCRGTEPIRYTKQIMMYYGILKRQGIEFGTTRFGG
jgi:membrane-bound lytic murein transglycosylase F